MKLLPIVVAVGLSLLPDFAPASPVTASQAKPSEVDQRAAALVARMTREEKVSQPGTGLESLTARFELRSNLLLPR